MITRRPGLRIWLIAFTGFFLLNAGWALAAPYDGPADEAAHAQRAGAVVHGGILPHEDGTLDIPSSLIRERCFQQHIDIAADCAQEPGGDSTLVRFDDYVGYYNPVYYAVTGWPLAIWPDWTGIMLTRLLTGALVAGLMAGAVVAACRWSRHRALLGALIVVATPMVISLGGAINPNGVEIAAAIALFAGLLPLVHEPRETINRSAVTLIGISASILVILRGLGPMWLVLDVAAVLIGCSWTQLRALARERIVRIWGGVVGLSLLGALAWTAVANPVGTVVRFPAEQTWQESLRYGFLDMWPNIANQMIGVTGWNELGQPRLVYVVWFTAAGLLVLGGLAVGNRIDRLRMLGLLAGTFIPLLGYELLTADDGWFNQGRYFLPGAVGVPMLGATVLARHFEERDLTSLIRTFATLLFPVHFVVLAYTMARWQSGLVSISPLNGSWLPEFGPELPLALEAAGIVIMVLLFWLAPRLSQAAPDRSPEAGTEAWSETGTEMLEPVPAGPRAG